MTDTELLPAPTMLPPEQPKWHRVPSSYMSSWTVAMHCVPAMDNPDLFIVTMDGPRGGEHARVHVTRQQLLSMIVAADNERARVNRVNEARGL